MSAARRLCLLLPLALGPCSAPAAGNLFDDVAGTYTGEWQSQYGHRGGAKLEIRALPERKYRATLVVEGSPAGYRGDEMSGDALVLPGDDVLVVRLWADSGALSVTGTIRSGVYLGHYRFGDPPATEVGVLLLRRLR